MTIIIAKTVTTAEATIEVRVILTPLLYLISYEDGKYKYYLYSINILNLTIIFIEKYKSKK